MERRLFETIVPPADSAQLNDRLPGKVVFPNDPSYNAARASWNLLNDRRPAVIVFAEDPIDVIEAVTFARKHRMPIAVQATGHRETVNAEGALLINTSRMQELRIDPQTRTAWVGAGVKWAPVLQEAQQYGLAPLLGSSSDIGVVGYSLSGGLGWLARKYGMSADSILRMEVVTLDGQFRRASLTENADLFWALRGGGGGFGIVTGMEIRLYPVSTVYAGNLYYPPHMAREIYQRYREWVKDMPEEMTSSIVLFNFTPLPEVPPELSGRSFVMIRGAYVGPVEEGERLLAYWRDWQAPAIDDFKARPFSEADRISNDHLEPVPAKPSGEWLTDLTEGVADALIRYTLPQEGEAPVLVSSEVRLVGGAVARVDPNSNAYSHRDQKLIWYSVGLLPDQHSRQQFQQQISRLREALAPWLTGKVYMNMIEGEEMRQRTRDGYSEQAFRRLQAIKAKYDPDECLISAFDIPPKA